MAKPKTRTYTGVFYPDDGVAPLDSLVQHMKKLRLPAIISPIHSADGDEAKPHVHFLVDYPAPVILETARADYGEFAANGYLEPVRSRKHMMRYFLHLDDPEKEQNLSPDDVVCVCGGLFDPTLDLTSDDVLRIKIEVQDYCEELGICEYYDLCRMVRIAEKYDWYRVVTTNTIHFSAYFRSQRHRANQENQEK